MARFFKTLIVCGLLLTVSCQEGGEAGDLLGQWRLAGSDNKYMSFSGSVVLLRSIPERQVFGSFQHRGDSLFLQFISVSSSRADTIYVEDTLGFSSFVNTRLKIERLSGSRLRLSQGDMTWNFRKY